jgi:hypothetical protein
MVSKQELTRRKVLDKAIIDALEEDVNNDDDLKELVRKQRRAVSLIVKLAGTAAGAATVAYVFSRHPHLKKPFQQLYKKVLAYLPSTLQTKAADVVAKVPEASGWFGMRSAAKNDKPAVKSQPTKSWARKAGNFAWWYATSPSQWLYFQPWRIAFQAGKVVLSVLNPSTRRYQKVPLDELDFDALPDDVKQALLQEYLAAAAEPGSERRSRRKTSFL